MVREQRELLGQGGSDGRRHVEAGQRRAGACCRDSTERAGKLLEIERVATALVIQLVCCGVVDGLTEEITSLGPGQRTEGEPVHSAHAVRPFQRAGHSSRHLTWTNREREKDGRIWRPA